MFKKSMMVVLAFGLGVGLFIGCGGGGSGGTVDDGGGDTATKTYKSLLFFCDLGDGAGYEVCRYDIVTNTIDRFRNKDNAIMEVWEGSGMPLLGELLETDGKLYMSAGATFRINIFDPLLHTTYQLIDLDNPGNFEIENLTMSNGLLYFVAESDTDIGRELHKYDIESDKASLVTDINDGEDDADIRHINEIDGVLYFSAFNGTQYELWKYDTATDLASMITNNNFNGHVVYVTNVDGILYFAGAGNENGNFEYGLWKYNTLTDNVAYIHSEDRIGIPLNIKDKGVITEVDNVVYFQGGNYSASDKGSEFYKYDITQDKVTLAADINKTTGGDSSSSPVEITSAHGILYFSADDDIHGRELWKYDLTTEQASLAYDINSGGKESHSNPNALVEVNDILYFSADDGVNGRELYKCTKEEGCSITKNMNGPNNTLPISSETFQINSETLQLKIIGSNF